MCLFVRRAPLMIQAFEPRAISCQRTPPIGWYPVDQPFERYIEPNRDAVVLNRCTVLRIDERAAARGDDDVAQGQQDLNNLALDGSKIGLAGARSRASISSSMSTARQSSRFASALASVDLPAAMNPTR